MPVRKDSLIKDHMTPSPHTIGSHENLKTARAMLREYGVRHLPVKKGGELIGVLSDRDIYFALAIEEKHDLEIQVEDIIMPDPYTVAPETELSEVVSHMSTQKLGSTLIEENGKLMGIYTTVDVCRDLAELLAE